MSVFLKKEIKDLKHFFLCEFQAEIMNFFGIFSNIFKEIHNKNNVKMRSFEENIDKIKKNATFSSFDKSFFEIEIPANKVPSGNQTFCEKIMNFWVLIKQKLSNPEGKSLDFQSF